MASSNMHLQVYYNYGEEDELQQFNTSLNFPFFSKGSGL